METKKFCEIIKQLRFEKQKTQNEVAKFLGISQQSYQKYELGITEPSIDKLIKLAQYFQVSVGFLVGTEEY